MERSELLAWWDEAHTDGVWWAPWSQAVSGLTASEAAWRPSPDRHCIWQIVEHMTFWRRYFVHRNRGGEPKPEDQLHQLNWRELPEITETAWRSTVEHFEQSHAEVRVLLTDSSIHSAPKAELELRYLLFHDCYHVGQIMYIRGLLGKPALES